MKAQSLTLGIFCLLLITSIPQTVGTINTSSSLSPIEEYEIEPQTNHIISEIKENFNCLIYAQVTDLRIFDKRNILGTAVDVLSDSGFPLAQWLKTYLPLIHRFLYQPLAFFIIVPLIVIKVFAPQLMDSRTHGNITFGHAVHYHEHNSAYIPSEGWVWTKGTEGIVTWNGSVYGRIKTLYGEWSAIYYDYYIGTTNFIGLKLRTNINTYLLIGYATHVRLGDTHPTQTA